MDQILWRIRRSIDDPMSLNRSSIFLMASTRESAKTQADKFLLSDPNSYEVTPLTNPGERITFLLEK